MNTGPFQDRRPLFAVLVTGHPDAIPAGGWTYSVLGREAFAVPGQQELRSYLDAVLWRRRDTHRVAVHCRGGRPGESGVDATVRAYCALRGLNCQIAGPDTETYGPDAEFRRDLELLARCHALVWFGPRHERDPVTLAIWLGIPYRVVELPAPATDEE